ncbi:CaiB/BaiF CoA transferase family protein [Syntrophobacter fumaroxidans]|uniref:Alpha-methylacyl-CoA racemase n=1 Tax=Syntrophobacter fumaroxidans (strain DSM 10017 / MPOB) TaxID=335543 RepID=A0LIG3_SYNFM|nr:CaiB/BaiF CoA-transferase family protein [Syntrophobacter fumaroxidans]ABK17215.1 Alpha-methylacyl-CoA racemase [Syntrophobacter fumaroxidans MPOB]
MQGALCGFTVLDLSRLLPGPFCSMLLADLGADVIKIEEPGRGDYIRWWPPRVGGGSGYHVVLNRNKRSLTLNLKAPEGKDIFRSLAKNADVVLESFRPGVMDKMGLGYERLAAVNPGIVFCAISGYGAYGPMALKAGHDVNYLARSGVLSYSGRRAPTMTGVQIADLGGGGLPAAFGILAALLARTRTGKGQFVDVSMTDGSLLWNCLRWGKLLGDRAVPAPADDMLNHGFACYNLYSTRDKRYMSLGALEPQFWKAFCERVGHPEWDTPQYFEPGSHQVELKHRLEALFASRTRAEWVEVFKDADCCCEPVLDLAEVMDDPQVRAREMVVDLIHDSWGAYRQLGICPRLSSTPGGIRSHAPELGEHTDRILCGLGYDSTEIERLRRQGVV